MPRAMGLCGANPNWKRAPPFTSQAFLLYYLSLSLGILVSQQRRNEYSECALGIRICCCLLYIYDGCKLGGSLLLLLLLSSFRLCVLHNLSLTLSSLCVCECLMKSYDRLWWKMRKVFIITRGGRRAPRSFWCPVIIY